MLRVTTTRLAAVAVLLAVATGYVAARWGSGHAVLTLAVAVAPLVPVFVLRPRAAAVAAIAALPFQLSVAGSVFGGLNVSVTDVLLAVTTVGLALALGQDAELRRRAGRLRPVAGPVGVYLAAMVVVTAAHPGWSPVVNAAQRVELVVIPLLLGAVVLTGRATRDAFVLFTLAALVLGLFWVLAPGGTGQVLGVQKNPAGQYLVDAALLVLTASTEKRLRWLLFPVFVVTVYATESRGALIGLLAGLVVYMLLHARHPLHVVLRAVPLVVVVGLLYAVLPVAEQARLRGDTTAVEYSDQVRRDYTADAQTVIGAHPVVGVGIGDYLAGSIDDLTLTDDPHNVFLLEAAEGGFLLLAAFVVLQLGGLVVVFRMRRRTPWALPAIAVQVAVLAHSTLDVYWVRGTPVLGFLLIGLALGTATPSTAGEARRHLAPPRAGRGVPRAPEAAGTGTPRPTAPRIRSSSCGIA